MVNKKLNLFSNILNFNMITIKFSDNIIHGYNNFETILQLDDYNDIVYINCNNNNKISNLPELPNSLEKL